MEPHIRETSDERLARELRDRIYAGDPAPGERLPATATIAAQYGLSPAMVQRAFGRLQRDGLVRGEHGRGTYVCDRRTYTARVVGPVSGRMPGQRVLADAERNEPAVSDLAVTDDAERRMWVMTVEAADVVPAAAVAVAVARAAGASGQVAVAVEPI